MGGFFKGQEGSESKRDTELRASRRRVVGRMDE